MQIEEYLKVLNFELPPELIAQKPAQNRTDSRLLVFDTASRKIFHQNFSEITDFLAPDTTLIFNDSKVENCRIIFDKSEIFVLQKIDDFSAWCLVRPGRKFKKGDKHQFGDFEIEVKEINTDGHRLVKSNQPIDSILESKFAHIPLPPYIKQDDSLQQRYQTVYAAEKGSKAAPTAGLHFDEVLLNKIKRKHKIGYVTLHVGLGTFAPLTEHNIATKKLHAEKYYISDHNAELINSAKHITAVGTTSTRTLESYARSAKRSDDTEIFITPDDHIKSIDSLITNFHLPSTSLLLMVSAFLATKMDVSGSEASEQLMKIYQEAINQKYRFFSFGDSMKII